MIQAIVLGGSGQVGSQLVSNLLRMSPDVCTKVTVLSRRPLPDIKSEDNPVVQVHVVDLDNFQDPSSKIIFQGHNAAFMLMGMGRPSQAESKEQLERVDADIPISFAQACSDRGIAHMSVLSSIGANPNSTYSNWTKTAAGGGWYLRCKGKMEEGCKNLPFSSLSVFRPGTIYPGNENTPSAVGMVNAMLNPILPGFMESVSSEQIALGMISSMLQQINGKCQGVHTIHGGKEIKAVGRELLDHDEYGKRFMART